MTVCPKPQSSVFGETVAANSRPWKDHVAVSGANLNGIDDLDQINAVSFCKETPFVKKSKKRCPKAILDNLCRFGFDGPIKNGEWKLLRMNDLI